MPVFSKRSKENLREAHPYLRKIAHSVIPHYDFAVIEGARGKKEQNRRFEEGSTQVRFPNSKHNVGEGAGREVSHAIDVAPYPIDWKDSRRFVYLAGMFHLAFSRLKKDEGWDYDLRWGGNWDADIHLDDNKFDDLGHFELD